MLGEIPIDIAFITSQVELKGNPNGWGQRVAYLLGDLTSSTRLSKACLRGVAVDAEDVWKRVSVWTGPTPAEAGGCRDKRTMIPGFARVLDTS